MLKKITGSCYKSMIDYGINHLNKHCATINELNVFPVPDGDTGTNMLMTLRNGLGSIGEGARSIAKVAEDFANATVFGARGNSGVITSQFFKGISEGLKKENEADCHTFFRALEKGREYAYASVSKPVEGTMLTVINEATNAVGKRIEKVTSIDEMIEIFVDEASRSLRETPKILPILAKAGVVDSGGAGVVYFFEGVQKYLKGEPLESDTTPIEPQQHIDYSKFNRQSVFEYGYCTEVLLQITDAKERFDYDEFLSELHAFGDSIATSYDSDKVKVHIHAKYPERVLDLCHRFGEFLSMKIENMSVQHTQVTKKYLCCEGGERGNFATVAVAPNELVQKMLSDMGADVAILSASPSSQDFIEAFQLIDHDNILVFPNSSNSILTAKQAASLYDGAKITVVNCRSIAQCYSAMAIIDYENSPEYTVSEVDRTIGNIYEVAIVHASKNIKYGDSRVAEGDYFALSGEDILATASSAKEVITRTVSDVLERKDCDVLNIFYGKNVSSDKAEELTSNIRESFDEIEVSNIETLNSVYDYFLSFE